MKIFQFAKTVTQTAFGKTIERRSGMQFHNNLNSNLVYNVKR